MSPCVCEKKKKKVVKKKYISSIFEHGHLLVFLAENLNEGKMTRAAEASAKEVVTERASA